MSDLRIAVWMRFEQEVLLGIDNDLTAKNQSKSKYPGFGVSGKMPAAGRQYVRGRFDFYSEIGPFSERRELSSVPNICDFSHFSCNSGFLFLLEGSENKSVHCGRGKHANQNPIWSNMNDDGFINVIAPTREMEASVRSSKTKEYDLVPNRSTQSRIHLLVQEMPHLIHEACLCVAVVVLFLIGGAVVLIGTKVAEGFELMFGEASSPS